MVARVGPKVNFWAREGLGGYNALAAFVLRCYSWRMPVRVVGDIRDREVIASGRSVRELRRLRGAYGGRRWRKCKGVATVELEDGSVREAELHWYEAAEVPERVELKIKRFV